MRPSKRSGLKDVPTAVGVACYSLVVLLFALPVVARGNPYRLFVSQIGYDSNMPQWALLRPSVDGDPNFPDSPNWVASTPNYVDEANSAAWLEVYQELGDGSYELVEANRPATIVQAPRTYQLNLYRVEWSSSGLPARGKVNVCVHVQPSDANLPAMDANEAAPVGRDLLFQDTWKAFALDEAKAREADEPNWGGGWFDDNCYGGAPVTHGLYTVGLVELLEKRWDSLSAEQRVGIRAQIKRGAEYLTLMKRLSEDPNYNDPGDPLKHFCEPNQMFPCGHPSREEYYWNGFGGWGWIQDAYGTLGLFEASRALAAIEPNVAGAALAAGASCYRWMIDQYCPMDYEDGIVAPAGPNDPNLGHRYGVLASIAASYYRAVNDANPAESDIENEISQHVMVLSTLAAACLPARFQDPNGLLIPACNDESYGEAVLNTTVEGMIYALEHFGDPNIYEADANAVASWRACCNTLAYLLQDRYLHNAFGVTTPCGRNNDAEFQPTGILFSWDPNRIVLRSYEVLGPAIAALELRLVLDDPNCDLDGIAAAHMEWLAGLNRGLRAGMVRTLADPGGNPSEADPNMVAAAFLYRVRGGFAKAWTVGWYPDANAPAVLFGGYLTPFGQPLYPWCFRDSKPCNSSNISGTGLWLSAIANYAEALDAGDVNRDGVVDVYDLSYGGRVKSCVNSFGASSRLAPVTLLRSSLLPCPWATAPSHTSGLISDDAIDPTVAESPGAPDTHRSASS